MADVSGSVEPSSAPARLPVFFIDFSLPSAVEARASAVELGQRDRACGDLPRRNPPASLTENDRFAWLAGYLEGYYPQQVLA